MNAALEVALTFAAWVGAIGLILLILALVALADSVRTLLSAIAFRANQQALDIASRIPKATRDQWPGIFNERHGHE